MIEKSLRLPRYLGGLFVFAFCCVMFSCNNQGKYDQREKDRAWQAKQPGMDKDTSRWVSWNVLLNKSGIGEQALGEVEDSILQWIRTNVNAGYSARFDIFFCPCDSSLYNIAATPLNGAGDPVVPPSHPNPPQGGSGDFLSGVNFKLERREPLRQTVDTGKYKVEIPNSFTTNLKISKKVLAIIDTGIDTLAFPAQTRKLIWQPPGTGLKLFNYVGGSFDDFKDDHAAKHGTSVAALSLWAMGDGEFPQLMILKALDQNKRGTSFTVNCAVSYAIQNKADVINASLGYYETGTSVDSIMLQYLNKAGATSPQPTYVFVAAGNADEIPNPGNLCDPLRPATELKPGRLFYPACFHPALSNVISVTGLKDPLTPCFYQNYSKSFVMLGVQNTRSCCKYYVPFLSIAVEGSSFATPIAAGIALRAVIGGGAADIPAGIASKSGTSPGQVTIGGRFMLYPGNPAFPF